MRLWLQVHDPTSPGGQVGPGASLGDLSGLANGPRFSMVSGEPFDADKAYKDSKLCNALFSREFARRLRESNSPVTCNAYGPGPHPRSVMLNQSLYHSAHRMRIVVFGTCNRQMQEVTSVCATQV